MHPDVKSFDEAWKASNEHPDKDRTLADEICRRYVNEHREELQEALGRLSIPDLVQLVTKFRNDGDEEKRIIVDMWLRSEFEPQNIGITVNMETQQALEHAIAKLGGN